MQKNMSLRRLKVATAGLPILLAAICGAETRCHVARTFSLGSPASWDYTTVDPIHHRLFVSHGDTVDVIDLKNGKIAGQIPRTLGVRGIAVASDLGRVYIASNHTDSVIVIDSDSLALIGSWKTGSKPDDVTYDAATGSLLSFNHDASATVFDAKTGAIKGTIALGGSPEFAVPDGKGKLFVNLQDSNEVIEIAPQTLTVDHRWPVRGCEAPTSIGIDPKSRRLFIGCHNLTLAVANADSGEIIQLLPIGPGVDGTVFDSETNLIFTASGDSGTMAVMKEEDADHFKVVQVVKTGPKARTIALDPNTHKVYLPFLQVPPVSDEKRETGKLGVVEIDKH
jgi:DNA-binding beta-propeller fold protein YncE